MHSKTNWLLSFMAFLLLVQPTRMGGRSCCSPWPRNSEKKRSGTSVG